MQIIAHRKNSIEELKSTPNCYGIEMDIRSFGKDLVVHHEPFTKGDLLEEWLKSFNHQTLILNVKEEGLEKRVLELVDTFKIKNYFFLDQSFPFLMKTAKGGNRSCAVRVSEYESIDTALGLAPFIDWCWVDCFTKFPLTHKDAVCLQDAGLKLCLVSPELQGFDASIRVPALRKILEQENISPEAVCTKFPELWR